MTNERDADALAERAIALHRKGSHAASARTMREALALVPDHPDRLVILAHSLVALEGFEVAGEVLEAALALAPGHWAGLNNLAVVREHQGRYRDALIACERSIELRPDRPEGHFNRGRLLLRLGVLGEGWREYAWREQLPDTRRAPPGSGTPWDLGPAPEAHLLVHAEQGLGDTLQFARYLPRARALVGRLTLAAQAPILPLLGAIAGVEVVDRDALEAGTDRAFDLNAPLLRLPARFTRSVSEIEPPGFTIPIPDRVRAQSAAPPGSDLAVGLAFAVNRASNSHRQRSVPPSALEPLAAVGGVAFHCLHFEHASQPAGAGSRVPAMRTYGDRIRGFDHLAALIDSLDLVITVDTVIAHLAGTLGKPTWVLLPFLSDWRWLLDRDDTPWYPSVRLFRQGRDGDWGPVIGRLREALARTAARHRVRATPV